MRDEKTKMTDLISLNIKYIFHQRVCTAVIAFIIAILSIIVPLFYMLAAFLYKDTTGQLAAIDFTIEGFSTDNQILYYIFITTISPFILSFLSILVSFIASAACFVSERENNTMSLLMLTTSEPIKIYDAKIFAVFIFSLGCTAVAALCSGIISIIGCSFMGLHGAFTFEKIIEFVLLIPGLVFLSTHLSYMLNRSKRKVFLSVTSCGYVCLPFVILHIGEFTGLYELSLISYFVIFAFLLAGSLVLYFLARKKIAYGKDI